MLIGGIGMDGMLAMRGSTTIGGSGGDEKNKKRHMYIYIYGHIWTYIYTFEYNYI